MQPQPFTEYHYTTNGVQGGHVPFSELVNMARFGSLQPNERVWTDGMANWEVAAEHAPLIAALQAPKEEPYDQLNSEPERTSYLAMWSLVLGIVGLFCFVLNMLGPVAVCLGGISLKVINNSGGKLQGKGLAVASIVLGSLATVILVVNIFSVVIPFGEALNEAAIEFDSMQMEEALATE